MQNKRVDPWKPADNSWPLIGRRAGPLLVIMGRGGGGAHRALTLHQNKAWGRYNLKLVNLEVEVYP
jgi:hypothetical protein